MGLIQHDAVIATTDSKEERMAFYRWMEELTAAEEALFVFGKAAINGFYTIVLLPDGSKAGWAVSHKGDALRQRFVNFLESRRFGDGSSAWDWVGVSYGELGSRLTSRGDRQRE